MSPIQSALMAQPLPLSETSPATALSSKSNLPIKAQDPEKVAKDFEGVFSSMLLKEMRNTLEPDSLFGQDSGDVFGGLFDQFIGQHMADSGGFGLAAMVKAAIERQQHPQSSDSSGPAKIN